MKYWIGIALLMSAVWLEAQVIAGHVYDEVNREPLPGASVAIVGAENGAATDADGYFLISDLEPGRYGLVVSFIGYESLKISDIWVKSGKVTVQDFELKINASNLSEIVVTSTRSVIAPGRISITEEQINRFAATYYDPARLLTSSPDVAVANDQNNRISVRGLSPAYNVWRLEGAEIINPNHLSNAGTFLDKPIPTGGGVNMLSAQMLSNSDFLYSTNSAEYGNSLGGIFDMKLKNGNLQQRQYTAQASLIGFDLATDGPFKKGGKTTYAANYRYSFTGLLTNFGVDFGGESIGFQDLSFNLSRPIGKRSVLKIFGVWGLNYNDFTHKAYIESEIAKDRSDIFYQNATGISGLSFRSGWNQSSMITTVVYSVTDNHRDQYFYNDGDIRYRSDLYHTYSDLLSIHSRYSRTIGGANANLGVMANHYQYRLEALDSLLQQTWMLRPYLDLSGNFNAKLGWEIGGSAMITGENQLIEWRSKLSYMFDTKNVLSIAAGRYGQLLNATNLYFNDPNFTNYAFDSYQLQSSLRYTIGYVRSGQKITTSIEAFAYTYPNVNVLQPAMSYLYAYVGSLTYENAYTTGVSMTLERNFTKGLYVRSGGSLYDSKIGEFANPYNTKYNLNLAVGKEWDRSKGVKDKHFSANLRGIYQGGKTIADYGLEATNNQLRYIFIPESYYAPGTYQTSPYLRFDLRLLWTRYRSNRTTSIALDLQNAASIRNEAYQYYDSFTHKVETQYQLGLIPILAYRVEW